MTNLNIHISEKAQAFAQEEAVKRGLPDAAAYAAALLEEAAIKNGTDEARRPGNFSYLSLLGAGKGCFTSPQEVDTFIRVERDAWEQ